ncbi:methionine ABC transporter substrate-binding protein [Cryobacterium sp. TMT1-21]|uniref:MetQ/NlpA family ABC transporter substrate-binding protein n=1 Tax=unclassified Cryobacterium TaxID=2649013 RepID=UPI00106D149F|nr:MULTISPECIES: MetQ/NlpA family ABC transporter substrate-binding protein [unclassified Cryobacterium]TFC80904.1 methionine ABC transporter substrate-binding protein [Cryobacterium sp. TmT2-59]TFD15568.1 methionine ABC transporter substrate-binding protein [Cryobacterium sp. TMT1-21]TFD18590.1 methionine ABC transporter substrate-binding protein [Cryobacterium sp. TMT4-10]TFD28391.1 methionine ABC transporter substrate-binding protein [Cryobacterium sp. TMT2-23]
MKKRLLAALAVVPLIALLAGCAAGSTESDKTVKIGVVGASDPYWAVYEKAAADAGITVDIVDFAEFGQPNPALSAGELDLNQFQHIVYLAEYNVASKADLVPVGATAIYPLALYSTRYGKVSEIKKGDTIAVPNDVSNLARALLVLQSAKLITLKDGGTIYSTLADIDKDKSKVTVTALEASLTATSLPDVAGAIINNDFVEKAGLKVEDALAQDDPSDPNALPYVNIFAARAEDKDNATFKKLVDIYQTTKAVQDGVLEVSGGSAELVTTPVADLETALAKVEKDTRAKK